MMNVSPSAIGAKIALVTLCVFLFAFRKRIAAFLVPIEHLTHRLAAVVWEDPQHS